MRYNRTSLKSDLTDRGAGLPPHQQVGIGLTDDGHENQYHFLIKNFLLNLNAIYQYSNVIEELITRLSLVGP